MRRDAAVIVLARPWERRRRLIRHGRALGGVRRRRGDRHAAHRVDDRRVSIGAAANGLRPVAEIQFADLIFPALNQLIQEAARIRYRSNGTFGCPITIRSPFGPASTARYTTASPWRRSSPTCRPEGGHPLDPYDAKGLLRSAIRDPDPVIFLEHKKMYRSVRGEVPDGEYTVPLGRATVTAREAASR